MRRHAYIPLLLIVCGLAVAGAQQQVRGQVVNRDGAPQACQIDFYVGTDLRYRATSDKQGYFFLNSPVHGEYRVVVVQGNRQDEFKRVTIDMYGLHPPTLVVRW